MFDMGIDYLSDIGEAEIIRYLTGCFESPKESLNLALVMTARF